MLVTEKFAEAPLAKIEADAPVPRIPPVLMIDVLPAVTEPLLITSCVIVPNTLDPIATNDPISLTPTDAAAPRAAIEAEDATPPSPSTETVESLIDTAPLTALLTAWLTFSNVVPETLPSFEIAATDTFA